MCGNLGLLLLTGEVDASKALEAMAKVTSMRGAQSCGFAAATPTRMRLYKAVVPKRGDVARTLRRAFDRTQKNARPLAVAGHLRFATSSKTTRRDAHPHVWLPKQKATVLTIDPQSFTFVARSVARAVVVTHNGDFEAFDLGQCFGDATRVVSLEETRRWLERHLGAPAPSSGDSIVAAGLIELLFAMGDPFAAARLAVATTELQRSVENNNKDETLLRTVVRSVAASAKRVLVKLSASVVSELSYTMNGQLTSDVRARRLNRLASALADDLARDAVVRTYLQSDVKTVALETMRNFLEADLRVAARRFLASAHGSFGLVVTSSLAPCTLVVASVKQPMQVGVGPGVVAYASERAALHVGALHNIEARRILRDGEVLWIAPSATTDQANDFGGGVAVATASIRNDAPFRHLKKLEDFDAVGKLGNALMMPLVETKRLFSRDVVGDELADTPRMLRRVRDSFRDPDSPNSRTASQFADALSAGKESRLLDLVIVGVEASLWVGEQWAANVRSVFPALRVHALSANKVLASLTAVARDATCGAQTPGYTAFPSGTSPAEAARGAVVLVLSHSGQTFPSLNAARALSRAGAHVFAVAGLQDAVIASDVLEQSFAVGAAHSNRLFSTDAGILIAEPASASTAALHVLLTELLFALAAKLSGDLLPNDLDDLRSLHDATVDTNVPMICRGDKKTQPFDGSGTGKRSYLVNTTTEAAAADDENVTSSPHDEAVALGRRWGNHICEPFLCFLAATAYVLGTVTAGTPLVRSVVVTSGLLTEPYVWTTYVVAAADALLYAFFPVVCALLLRFFQGRELLARFGKRTVLMLDVPQVHQCVTAYAQKLFALSYGLNGVDVHGANPGDHAVHKVLHRTARGTLVALGVPDGRLKALVDAECAAFLTASQIKSISHWGVGAELLTVGHHSFRPAIVDGAVIFDAFTRPAFLSELAHGVSTTEKKADDGEASPTKKRGRSFKKMASSSKKKELALVRKRSATTPDARRIAFLTAPADVSELTSGGSKLKHALGSDDDLEAPVIGATRVTPKGHQPNRDETSEILRSHTIVETLYEGRVAALERQLALYVLFHAAARRASLALWPLFHFDVSRSQAGTRVATTPAPISPAVAGDRPRVVAGVQIERVTTTEDFLNDKPPPAGPFSRGSPPQWRTLDYDTLSVHTDDNEGSLGLDLSAYDQPFLPPSTNLPIPEVDDDDDDEEKVVYVERVPAAA